MEADFLSVCAERRIQVGELVHDLCAVAEDVVQLVKRVK